MATTVKIDIKTDLGITLADFNANGHLGTFEVPVWATDIYKNKTDEEIFDDWAAAIYESFSPIIGETAAWLYVANNTYFNSDKIKGNIRLAMYQEISNWMMNVPFEVKNNVNFSAQAGFSFSLSIQPWLINYDEFNIKTRTYIQETGLIGLCVEDIEGIELWVHPQFKTGEFLETTNIVRKLGEIGDIEVVTKEYLDDVVQSGILNSHKQIKGDVSSTDLVDMTAKVSAYNSGSDLLMDDGTTLNNKPYDAITNPNGATEGDIVNFIPSDANTVMEEGYVLKSLQMFLSTNNEALNDINVIRTKDVTQDSRLTAIESFDKTALTESNDKDVTGFGALDTSGHATNGGRLVRRDEIVSALGGLKQEADANKVEADATKAESATTTAQVALNTPAIATNVNGIAKNVTDIATNKSDITSNTDKINVNIAGIAGTDVRLTTVENETTTNSAAIVILKGDDSNHDGRIQALELAGSLNDKVWTGSITGASSVNLSAIVDQNGDKFIFKDGSLLEVVVEESSSSLEQGHYLTVGKANATTYVIGTRTLNVKLDNTGHLAIVETGAGDLSDFNVIKVLESKSTAVVSASYSKSESDGKYTLKTTTAALDTRVATNLASIGTISTDINTNKTDVVTNKTNIAKNVTAIADNTAKGIANATATTALTTKVTANTTKGVANTAAIGTKQNRVDNTLTTISKIIPTAINELVTKTNATDTAYKAADTAITTAYKAADTALDNAYKAADAVVTAAYKAADAATLTAAKTYTDAHTPTSKTITIPAEYGWVKVDTTKPIDNAKWKSQSFRCIVYVGSLVKNRYELSLKLKQFPNDTMTVLFFESSPDGTYSPTISSMDPGNLGSSWPVDADNYYEMWDVVTPAQTVKVLA